MSLEELVLDTLRRLPAERQKEVLEFARSLSAREPSRPPRRSARGLCADLSPAPSEEDIAEARRELWGAFPREDLP